MLRTVLCLLVICASAPVPAAALTLLDGSFADADWNASELLDTGGDATFSASQQLAGGNPDAFRQTSLSIPTSLQSLIVSHVYQAGQYDPAALGAIESIDFSLDLRFTGGSVGTSLVGYQLLLEQGGALYNSLATATAVAAGPGQGAPGPWLHFSFTGLDASDFTRLSGSGPSSPDFSTAGSSLRFGYLNQNTAMQIAISTTSGIDNWSVVVHSVPEPSAGVLVAGLWLGLAFARRVAAR
jgi:hypothetical protein